ncbi:hypothetical protein OOK60_13585 [Trichothermofontia sichuanensis B231]|nr:hypothetical protein [Trichothermofontia sichuanensis]UZQ53523.1 hypothetical protein OOK60_13585 [Trichothermofontia sichuanensis B231]
MRRTSSNVCLGDRAVGSRSPPRIILAIGQPLDRPSLTEGVPSPDCQTKD